jgi:uncharacterized protein YkwD
MGTPIAWRSGMRTLVASMLAFAALAFAALAFAALAFAALAFATLAFAALAASPANAASVGPDVYRAELAAGINDYRAQHQLPPLATDAALAALAQAHARTMAQQDRLSHDGFPRRFEQARARTCVENVGWNYESAKAELDGWRHSPEHDRNLLDARIARMGLGIENGYAVFFACS